MTDDCFLDNLHVQHHPHILVLQVVAMQRKDSAV